MDEDELPFGASSANPYSVGMGILTQNGVGIQGGAVTSSSGGGLGAGERVYMGAGTKLSPEEARKELKLAGGMPSNKLFMSVDDARNLPLDWARNDPKKLKEFVNKGIIAKVRGFDSDMGMPEIMSAWDDLVSTAVTFSKSGQDWTPWDVMDTYGDTKGKFGTERRGDWVYDVATDKPVKYVGATTKTQTNKKVNLTSIEDVRALAMQTLREALGRAPTTEEVAQFRTSINALETASPEVGTTTVQLKPNLATGEVEQGDSTTTSSGGVSQAAMESVISQSVQGSPEAAKYQGGTTYFNALMGMLGG